MSARSEDVEVEVCRICGNDQAWHRDFKPVHEYASGGARFKAADYRDPAPPQPRPLALAFPSDPALRLALIEKGIIEPHDLTRAEERLQVARVTGSPVVAGADGGPSAGGVTATAPRSGGSPPPGDNDHGRRGD